jgi:hypothetical protein
MSDINFGEIKVTPRHKQDGVWWGNATEVARVAIDTEPEVATSVGVLYAGRKAIDIVQRGYSFADPARDEPELDLDQFLTEREVEGVVLRPQGIHVFRRHLSHGVGLFSPGDENPFGLVVPGKGTIVKIDKIDEFKRVADEALLRGPLEEGESVNDIMASKAIGLTAEYSKLPKVARPVVLL